MSAVNLQSITSLGLMSFCRTLAIVLCLCTVPAFGQETPAAQTGTEASWQPPDPTRLPFDWWQQFDSESPETVRQRADLFGTAVRQAIGRLDGEDLVTAHDLLQNTRGQLELLLITRQPVEPEQFEPIPTREVYSLEELLALRAQWRSLEKRQKIPQLRLTELKDQAALLYQRRDNLAREFSATDVNSPERILLGLNRINARIEYELAAEQAKVLKTRVAAIDEQRDLLRKQFDYARGHLAVKNTDVTALEEQAANALEQVTQLSAQLADAQALLLEVLSAKAINPSLGILRKQQVTRTTAELALARLQSFQKHAITSWYRLRSQTPTFDYDIQEELEKAEAFTIETREQIEVWTAASQTTLLSPAPAGDLNSVKNIDLAHSAAQDTLGLIDDINDFIDDLNLLEQVLTVDQISLQHGLQSVWARLIIAGDDVRDALARYLDFTLFHINDAPVTVGSILRMFFILFMGFAISFLIRFLLRRLKGRRQYANSPAVYTLGRVLHYIIVLVAVLAALSSIGLDFRSFALIAGALSVGIGFGLQSIVNNFVSGLILLFEGSMRVGDYVELDTGVRGIVKEVNTRATIVRTNDSIDLVVPNSNFVNSTVTNWTLREPLARFRIDFGVAYGSDKEAVKEAALAAAEKVDFIVQHMPSRKPEVWLVNYGDSSLDFQLLAWVTKAGVRRPERVRAAFLWELETQLKKAGIEIPFPQRDLHLRSGFTPAEPELL